MFKFLPYLGACLFACTLSIAAQEAEVDTSATALHEKMTEVKGQVEGMNETLLEMKSTLDALKKIKISGYMQAQFVNIGSEGSVGGYSGGGFDKNQHNHFQLRRGRLKVVYDNDLTQYVVQFDAVPSAVTIKDAYITTKEPWLKAFSLTAGVFDRPFGFEISYSSSSRETPERSRLFQTLFPGERDLGAKIEFGMLEGPLSFLNFKGGFFTGNGIANETDNAKDFIGRLGVSLPFTEENLAIDAGASLYSGKVLLETGKKAYKLASATSAGTEGTGKYIDRKYFGADVQIYYDLPVIGGFSLRGEFITGKQPGNATNSNYHKVDATDIYVREFSGYYINYVQNLGLSNQFVLKYDVYDPNTKVSGDEIGANAAAKLSAGDIKYNTLGIGLVHHWDANVKFTCYYEKVKNETSAKLIGFDKDIKDDVFTVRMQYKF